MGSVKSLSDFLRCKNPSNVLCSRNLCMKRVEAYDIVWARALARLFLLEDNFDFLLGLLSCPFSRFFQS